MSDESDAANDRRLWNELGEIKAGLKILLEDRGKADDRMMSLQRQIDDRVTWKSALGIASLIAAAGEAVSHWIWKP